MNSDFARFEYILLDASTRQLVEKRADEIKGLVKRLAKDTIEIGQKLIEVKELLPHGLFDELTIALSVRF
jgi:hypothetical protein